MSFVTRLLGLDEWKEEALRDIRGAAAHAINDIDSVRSGVMDDVAKIRSDAMDGITAVKTGAVGDIEEMKSDAIKSHFEKVYMDSAYIIHVPESMGMAGADRLRAAMEEIGSHCVVVAGETMNVLTFTSKT